jgi:hypothetical protein
MESQYSGQTSPVTPFRDFLKISGEKRLIHNVLVIGGNEILKIETISKGRDKDFLPRNKSKFFTWLHYRE